MISNSSLREMGNLLRSAESIVIFPHESPDGDALGSCAALCRALRNEGKDAWVLLDEEIRGYLEFMDTEYCTTDIDCVSMPDICICVDCSEENTLQRPCGKIQRRKDKALHRPSRHGRQLR
ncbi:MAG: DHH family phosphoesterase [Clostridia bacterium]